MGLDLRFIQMHIKELSRENIQLDVANYLVNYLNGLGFVEKEYDRGEVPDLVCFVGPIANSDWLTIFVQDRLHETTKLLSEKFLTTVIFAGLVDSDAVLFQRFHDGEHVDDYSNDPLRFELENYSADTPEWHFEEEEYINEITRGDVSKWMDLVSTNQSEDEIEAIWRSTPVFADDIFWATCEAFGIDVNEMGEDVFDEILDDLVFGEELEVDFGKYYLFTFEYDKLPKYTLKAEGQPKFSMGQQAQVDHRNLTSGFNYPLSIISKGGAADGFQVRIWGSALESGAITLETMSVAKLIDPYVIPPENRSVITEVNLDPVDPSDIHSRKGMMVANLEDFEVPVGMKYELYEINRDPDFNAQKALDEYDKTKIGLHFKGSVNRVGSYELYFSFEPKNGDKRDILVFKTPVVIEKID